MKKIVFVFVTLLVASAASAQIKWKRIEASDMTLVGKAFNWLICSRPMPPPSVHLPTSRK